MSADKPRIAIAGFQHETNCFAAAKTGLDDFMMADSWPGLLRGEEVLRQTRGMNLPIAGFAAAAEAAGVEVVPVLWCAAEPSGYVRQPAFEEICVMLLEGIRQAGDIDGVYLDLHGAMVTEAHADGEGELLRRVRELVGAEMPVAVSLDLHANISPAMAALASTIAIYRTYPHLDMADTGARCLPALRQLLQGAPLCKAFAQMPYLMPLHAQCTDDAPCKGIYELVRQLCSGGNVHADVALGFTAADFPDTRPSCVAYAPRQQDADAACARIKELFIAGEDEMDCTMLSPDEAVRRAAAMPAGKPVIFADVQDNPGAGATSDTTGILHTLAQQEVQGALMGLFHDPAVAGAAHAHGVGAVFSAPLGGKSGMPGQAPFCGAFRVVALSDGNCRYSGEMYGGGTATMGKTAALKLTETKADITIVVTSIRNQCLDLAHFTHLMLDPASYRIICVKSTVHYRAAFAPLAAAALPVESPGAFPCDLQKIPYRNLHPEVMRRLV